MLQFRLVVKTALKLLLVFVEYTETNAQHLIKAVNAVDKKRSMYMYLLILSSTCTRLKVKERFTENHRIH